MVKAKQPRRRKAPEYKRFHFSKRIKHPSKMTGSFRLMGRSLKVLKQNWKLFGGLLLIYVVLSLIFVRGFGNNSNLTELKSALDEVFTGTSGQLSSGLALFGVVVSSASGGSETASVYQQILQVVMGLAFIWALRSVYGDKNKIKVRDALYKGMYPLVPLLLVLVFIAIQLLPMIIGAGIYSLVVNNGLAVGGLEQLAWGGVFFLLAVWSLYLVTPSVLAVFVVTLPGMAPRAALKTSRKMVKYRRWTVMRKELFLPLALVAIVAAITLPFIIWLTPVAEWVYFILSLLALPVILSYLYSLYRELL